MIELFNKVECASLVSESILIYTYTHTCMHTQAEDMIELFNKVECASLVSESIREERAEIVRANREDAEV